MQYQNFGEQSVDPNDFKASIEAYSQGFVFTRTEKGHMEKVRSVRVDLEKFSETSENRRILRKYDHEVRFDAVPFDHYSWQIHKLGKDFYETKFGSDTFSANKIKELFTTNEFNFNNILSFELNGVSDGYCITYLAEEEIKILHYAYPFYNLELIDTNFGIYMMTKTLSELKAKGFKYSYLGSAHDVRAIYKLQFEGVEWFDETSNEWVQDVSRLKKLLRNS